MMLNKFFSTGCRLLAAAGALFLSSCETDLDPNADYKETTIIYGLLNPEDTEHFVKVNKAFLNTKTNALTIAKTIPDSTTYKEISVVLERLRPGRDSQVVASFPLKPYLVTDKSPNGDFYYPEQMIYTTGTIPKLDLNSIYRIKATNPKTGNVVYGSTELVKDFCVRQVSTLMNSICFGLDSIQPFSPEGRGEVRFTRSENAYVYTASLQFSYIEILGTDTVQKEINWKIASNFSESPQGMYVVQIPVQPNSFFEYLKTVIDWRSDNPNLKRKAVENGVKLIVTAGTKEMETYWRVNNSYSFISQTRPEYDNIANGTGLFASRRKRMAVANLTPRAIDALVVQHPELKFIR